MEITKSADGTAIAYDRAGHGPPLVVVVGAFCDRRTFVPPAELTGQFTVCTYDRRGRGDSGDTQPYSPDREIEDLAAVVEACGGASVFAYGHSSGPRWRCKPPRGACRSLRSRPTSRRT